MRPIRAMVIATLLASSAIGVDPATAAPALPCAPGEATKLAAVPGHAYQSAYFSMKGTEDVYTDQWIDDWIAMTGKQPAVIVFSNHWGRNGKLDITFPSTLVQMMWNHGALPDVRMMPWTTYDWRSNGGDPVVTMQRIVNGRFDRPLTRWFTHARDLGIPIMLEFGVEVNGDWFPWNGRWNGGGKRTGFGDPTYPDGPERFIAAYRHIHDIADAVGATNITWAFHVDVGTYPHKAWNRPAKYYPGDAYVDWVLVSNYGEQDPTWHDWTSFTDTFGDPSDPTSPYARITAIAPSKPFGVIEFGVTEDPRHDKAAWYTDAYASMTPPGNTYAVSIASVWSERWRNGNGTVSDLRVNSSPSALSAYQNGIADPFFVSVPQFSCG